MNGILSDILSLWPNALKKGKIRQVLGERILGIISGLSHDLKRQFSSPLFIALLLTLTASKSQSKLDSFTQGETHATESPQELVQEKSMSGNDSDTPPNPEGGGSDSTPDSSDGPNGIIYARVSSGGQLNGNERADGNGEDDGSISGQISELEDLAEKQGIALPYDPITDEAKTGTNFDRDGIQEVFELSKRDEIDFLLVEKIDRIGRSAPETLYFIYILQSECGVTLLTPAGEQDIGQVRGLLHTTLMSLMAEVQNSIRTAKAKKERIRGFLKKKKWKCYSPKVPLGYEETDDGWLTVDDSKKVIVRDMFKKFAECKVYSETEEYIDEKYGTEALSGHRVKTLLQETVYIGEPRLPDSWIAETSYENDLNCPDLHLLGKEEDAEIDITEETFHQVQAIIEEKDSKHSTDEDTPDLLDFLEEFSLFAVVEGTEPATLLHHCGEPLVKDGQIDLKGNSFHRYRCPRCEESDNAEEYYRQWPREHELDAIKQIQAVLDGDMGLFEND